VSARNDPLPGRQSEREVARYRSRQTLEAADIERRRLGGADGPGLLQTATNRLVARSQASEPNATPPATTATPAAATVATRALPFMASPKSRNLAAQPIG